MEALEMYDERELSVGWVTEEYEVAELIISTVIDNLKFSMSNLSNYFDFFQYR